MGRYASRYGATPSVLDVLATARKVLDRALKDALGTRDPTGACLYGAVLARQLVEGFIPGARAVIRGGDGGQDGGCRDPAGALRGHYWVEVELADGKRGVADITADQFGHPPIRWLPLPGAAILYEPGRQDLVDESVRDIEDELALT